MKKDTWASREPKTTKAIKVALSKLIPSIFLEFAGLAVTSFFSTRTASAGSC